MIVDSIQKSSFLVLITIARIVLYKLNTKHKIKNVTQTILLPVFNRRVQTY